LPYDLNDKIVSFVNTTFDNFVGGRKMESINHSRRMSSLELANHWSPYQNNSLSRCMLRDKDMSEVLQYAFEYSESQ
jgi:hypothetical protein